MKAPLINTWLNMLLYGSLLATKTFEKERKRKCRIESILWQRYGYDIALKHNYVNQPVTA